MGTSQHQGVQSIVTDKIIHIILYSQIHDIIVDDPFLYQWHEGGTRRLEYVETCLLYTSGPRYHVPDKSQLFTTGRLEHLPVSFVEILGQHTKVRQTYVDVYKRQAYM